MSEPRNLKASRTYVEQLGWPVFPVHCGSGGRCSCGRSDCNSPGKHPITQAGFHDASKNLKEVEAWWKKDSWASVGIPTGEVSGLIVLDVDPRNGGQASLAKLVEEHGELPKTVTCRTGGGGVHYYFRHPGGHLPKAKPWQGVDVQSDGGYVVAPLSVHIRGETYMWEEGKEPRIDRLADAPLWLLEALQEQADRGDNGTPAEVPEVYEDGARNNRLFSDACSMRRRGFGEDGIYNALLTQNAEKCSPPLSEREVAHIAKSAMRYDEEPGLAPGQVEGYGDKKAEKKPLRVLTLDNFMTQDPEPPPWVVPEWKAEKEMTVLAGEWGVGKSLVALHLAMQQAREDRKRATFLGGMSLRTPQQRILYLDEENATPLVRQRVQMIANQCGISKEQYQETPFFYMSLQGVNLDIPAGWDLLKRAIDKFEPEEIFFDSLVRFHLRDENSNSEMAKFFAMRLQPLSVQGIALTFVHHMGKVQGADGKERDVRHKIRGASEIPGFFHEVWAMSGGSNGPKILQQCKNRWGKTPPKLDVFIEEGGEDGEAYELEVRGIERLKETDNVMWRVMADQGIAGVLQSEIVRELERSGMAHEAARKAVARTAKRYRVQGKVKTKREGHSFRFWLSQHAPSDAE